MINPVHHGFTFGPDDTPLEIATGILHKPKLKRSGILQCRENCCIVIYLVRGEGTYRDGLRTLSVKAGDVILRIPEVKHEITPTSNGQWVERYIMLPRTYWEGLVQAGISAQTPVWKVGLHKPLLEIWQKLDECVAQHEPSRIPEALLLAQQFLVRAWEYSREINDDVQKQLLHRVCKTLSWDTDASLSLPDIAEELGMGYEHFRKCFRQEFGVAPGKYRQRVRMQRAQCLLITSEVTVKEIAAQMGYSDAFTFSKEFKRYAGMSPLTYRQEN